MDQKSIQAQIKKNVLLEGYLMKRSKFLKQWRKRWVVLTANFLFTFTNKKYQEMTDVVEVKEIVGLKSYLKKEDDLTPTSFKIESSENTLHFSAETTQEKWAWIVVVERLVDFKMSNYSQCKSIGDVKSMGFASLQNFNEKEKGKKKEEKDEGQEKESKQGSKQEQKKSQNTQNLLKMISLFKSQEEQNRKLRNEITELITSLKDGCEEEKLEIVTKISNMHEQNSKNEQEQQIEGLIKGLIISKKMQSESKSQKKEIIESVTSECKKQTTMNWISQLKDLY